MIKTISYILVFLMLSVGLFVALNNQSSNQNEEMIFYVHGAASYTFSVPCNMFEQAFLGQLDSLSIKNTEFANRLKSFVAGLVPDSENELNDIDTRRIIHVNVEGEPMEICLGYTFGVSINGQIMQDDEELFRLVNGFLDQ